MNDHGKSDGCVVPAKPANKTAQAVAELVEGRRPATGNTNSSTHPGRSAGQGCVKRACAENVEVVFVAEAMLFERWKKEPVFVRFSGLPGSTLARECPKPLQGASVKSRGLERCSQKAGVPPSGMHHEDERKRTFR